MNSFFRIEGVYYWWRRLDLLSKLWLLGSIWYYCMWGSSENLYDDIGDYCLRVFVSISEGFYWNIKSLSKIEWVPSLLLSYILLRWLVIWGSLLLFSNASIWAGIEPNGLFSLISLNVAFYFKSKSLSFRIPYSYSFYLSSCIIYICPFNVINLKF